MEHCSHFPRCNKSDCPYPHVKPTNNQICQDFAELGWCSKGSTCSARHVRECPEFSSKGTCSNANCRLRHVINRNKNDPLEGGDDQDRPEDHHSQGETDHGTSGGLFFTDLTGSANDPPNGKRKASQRTLDSNQPHHQRTYKGISHNSGVNKRFKYDAVADNEDFVMFISSDEEQTDGSEVGDSELAEDDGGDIDPSSVDSEEMDSVMLEEGEAVDLTREKLDSKSDPSSLAALPMAHPTGDEAMMAITERPSQPRWNHDHISIKLRSRSLLEPGEEIEDGEIFDDDPDETVDEIRRSDEEQLSYSSDEDEIILRQLLGNRSSSRSGS